MQNPNDLVVVAPQAFHQGINASFCMADAVNFTCKNYEKYAINNICKPTCEGYVQTYVTILKYKLCRIFILQFLPYPYIFSKGPPLDCRDLLRVSSNVPLRDPPAMPEIILPWEPSPGAAQQEQQEDNDQHQDNDQEEEDGHAHCRVAFLPTDERIEQTKTKTNRCSKSGCGAIVSSYCSPRCFLLDEQEGGQTFYCLRGDRNCFYEAHATLQPRNRLPVHCTVSICHKYKVSSSRFKCSQCDNRYCLLNGKGCFYSQDHYQQCDE